MDTFAPWNINFHTSIYHLHRVRRLCWDRDHFPPLQFDEKSLNWCQRPFWNHPVIILVPWHLVFAYVSSPDLMALVQVEALALDWQWDRVRIFHFPANVKRYESISFNCIVTKNFVNLILKIRVRIPHINLLWEQFYCLFCIF